MFDNKTRPEVIFIMLSKAFADKKKIISKLEKFTNEFNDNFIKSVSEKKSMIEKQDGIKELYSKYFEDVLDIIK